MAALNITREQLAKFLGNDARAIKQFESLFTEVQEITDVTVIDLIIQAANGTATATQALASLQALAESLDKQPPSTFDASPLAAQIGGIESAPSGFDPSPMLALLQGLEAAPIPQEHLTRHAYGSFYDATDQTAAAANTAYAVAFGTAQNAFGITVASSSRLTVDRPGVYDAQWSVQAINADAAAKEVWLWIARNGTAITATTRRTTIASGAVIALSSALAVDMAAGDYLELYWEVSDTDVSLFFDAASGVHPAIPSAMMTIANIRSN